MITEFAAAMTLAAHVWGAPACGQPTEAVEPYPVGTASAEVARMIIGFADMPWTLQRPDGSMLVHPGCRVVITPTGITYGDICTTVVHEWGHLKNGPAHSSDPLSVMYPNPPQPYWRCIYGTNTSPLSTYKHGWKRRWAHPRPGTPLDVSITS